jgi:hypothetical protein
MLVTVAADNLRSYVRDVILAVLKEGCRVAITMAAIIGKTESEEHKAALYQEARVAE